MVAHQFLSHRMSTRKAIKIIGLLYGALTVSLYKRCAPNRAGKSKLSKKSDENVFSPQQNKMAKAIPKKYGKRKEKPNARFASVHYEKIKFSFLSASVTIPLPSFRYNLHRCRLKKLYMRTLRIQHTLRTNTNTYTIVFPYIQVK